MPASISISNLLISTKPPNENAIHFLLYAAIVWRHASAALLEYAANLQRLV